MRTTDESPAHRRAGSSLTRFRDRGGKVIIYHGLADQLIPAAGTIDYYKRVQQQMGGPRKTSQFARLFLAPGVDHGFRGAGPTPIMNLFDCGIEKNASHFTGLRMLNLFLKCRGQITREGRGYFDIGQAAALFEDVFDDREDFVKTLNRLVHSQLLEVNTRSTENILGASHARVTSSGWYYHKNLVNTFSYLDLVLQDTPLNSQQLAKDLRDSVVRVDNMNDFEQMKVQRLQERFSRVEKFLDYLEGEENEEFERFNLDKIDSVFSTKAVPAIRSHFVKQRNWITKRVEENREKYMEESLFDLTQEDQAVLDSLLTQDSDIREDADAGSPSRQ